MTTPVKLLYGSPTAITCTLSGLADSAARQSVAIDNSANLFMDFIIELTVAYPNNAPSGGLVLGIAPSVDGTNFASGATGTDASYDWATLGNDMPTILSFTPIQNGTIRHSGSMVWTIGYAPLKFSLIVSNVSGFTLSAGTSLQYTGIKAQFG